MRHQYFIFVFISTHIFFIFFQIHKHSKIIRLSYQKQKNEQNREQLTQKIRDLTQKLYTVKEHDSIKNFAKTKLGMRKIKLSQVKTLNSNDLEATTDEQGV